MESRKGRTLQRREIFRAHARKLGVASPAALQQIDGVLEAGISRNG
jgi:hypothetical protein